MSAGFVACEMYDEFPHVDAAIVATIPPPRPTMIVADDGTEGEVIAWAVVNAGYVVPIVVTQYQPWPIVARSGSVARWADDE